MFEDLTDVERLTGELARLRADGRERTVAELVDLVGACQSVMNHAGALQTLAIAHLAAVEDVTLEDGTFVEEHRGLGHHRFDAPALVSEQLGMTDAGAGTKVSQAVDLASRLPEVVAAMGQGRLDGYRAGIVSDELRDTPREVCREVMVLVEPSLGTEPGGVLRRRVRRALERVDADLLRTKAKRARADRSLSRWAGEPGVDQWRGSFPVEQSRTGWAVVDGLARQYVREGRAQNLEQARADALMDLIHARASGSFTVQLAVPASQVAEQSTPQCGDDDMVPVSGLGLPGVTHVRRNWLESLTRGLPGLAPVVDTHPSHTARPSEVEVVACDDGTGALLTAALGAAGRRPKVESNAYSPPPVLIELVKARDGRCRFPGCTINARFCDVDHVLPWPLGPTRAANLMCLCRRHHRIKQTVRWRVRIAPDTTVTWTDPTGRERSTNPEDFLGVGTAGLAAPWLPAPALAAAEVPASTAAAAARPGAHLVDSHRLDAVASTDAREEVSSVWEDELAYLLDVERVSTGCRERGQGSPARGAARRRIRAEQTQEFPQRHRPADLAFVSGWRVDAPSSRCPRQPSRGRADEAEPPF